jgi:hypothetical protein
MNRDNCFKIFLVAAAVFLVGCSDKKEDGKGGKAGKSYSFTAAAKASIGLKSQGLLETSSESLGLATSGPTLCSSVICFTPTTLTGKYYGTGLLIQSNGNGMSAYFGKEAWSEIKGTSESMDFSSASPLIHSGNLFCCNGSGDLESANSYVSDVMYLFGYLDATFTVSGVTGNTSMNREFVVRFVLADGAIPEGKRGDLLLKDTTDGVFKWMDSAISADTLFASRPQAPVVMNTSVTNWTNPFGTDKGNQTIPVIYAGVLPASGSGNLTVKEAELAAGGKTYTFGFDPSNFVMFPTLLLADINMLSSLKELLSRIHLGGLPHSAQSMGVGSPASTVLRIDAP